MAALCVVHTLSAALLNRHLGMDATACSSLRRKPGLYYVNCTNNAAPKFEHMQTYKGYAKVLICFACFDVLGIHEGKFASQDNEVASRPARR